MPKNQSFFKKYSPKQTEPSPEYYTTAGRKCRPAYKMVKKSKTYAGQSRSSVKKLLLKVQWFYRVRHLYTECRNPSGAVVSGGVFFGMSQKEPSLLTQGRQSPRNVV